MSSPLDDARVTPQVETTSQRNAMEFDDRGAKTWLDPISMSKLQVAVKAKKKTVVLNGREYNITYGHFINLPASGDKRECVKLKRVDGVMAPFGYVGLDRLDKFDFESND